MRLSRLLNQTIVYWGTPSYDGYGGRTFDDPVELTGRWEDKNVLFIDSNGSERTSESIIYLTQAVDIGGFLYLGELDDFSSSATEPQDHENAREIRSCSKSPDVKGTTNLFKVML